MKTNSSFSVAARVTIGTLFSICGIALLCAIPLISRAQNPASGSVGPTGPAAAWDGTIILPIGGVVNDESLCQDGINCEVYTLTVTGTQAQWAGQRVRVLLAWQNSANEYDIYIHQGPTTSGPLVTSAMSGPGLTNQVAYINPATDGVGVFTIHIAYDIVPLPALDHYHGTASAVPETPVPPPPAPQDTGAKIGYENFEAPGVLTQVTQSSSGGLTVEYMGRGAGEPSVGSNWNTGVANFQSDLETLFITFDDSCSPLIPKATWVNRRAPTSQFIDSDPIGFTDRQTGRVFAAELTLLSPDTVKISHTDDDGITWVPDQSGGVASAVDHETIGGGPFHAPLVPPPPPAYQNAVYYCSQDIAFASCALSVDGGQTYGASVPIYNLTACGGLHGHVKVSPVDGTVYVPNRQCGSTQAVVVSQDNGVTWAIRPVQNGTTASVPSNVGGGDDPAVGIDNSGRVYFGFSNAGTAPSVATSTDQGATWQNIYDVGSVYGISNVAFPAAVGGDAGRAAIAYYASTTSTGDSNSGSFGGVWHLYVAHTFNGGLTWTTSDVTPLLPMQRSGLLRGGGAETIRNLLDFFDITIDRDGRVLVGYVNGCSGGDCAQAASTAKGNTYSATATIARQSSGRRMLAAHDPASSTSVSGIPFLTQRRSGSVVHLAWNESDTGNLMITSYQILRSTVSGAETFLTSVAGSQTGGTYDDATATDITETYYYKVVAVNSAGSSCGNNEVAAPYLGDNCTGIVIHKNEPNHPEATGGGAAPPPGPSPVPTPPPGSNTVPQLLIDYVAVAEPPTTPGKLMFKMKVGNLTTVPPNSRWRIAWNYWTSPSVEMYYVGMKSDSSSAVTFEYGTLADAGVPAVLILSETPIASLPSPAEANFNADGTITMLVPKSAVGNPQVGDLLGAIGGKTITGDSPGSDTFERSTTFVDHTFVKGQADNSYPPATYTLSGNGPCPTGGIVPVGAVSRKTHGTAGTFDINLPLTGRPGIECRTGGASNDYMVVITFASPVTVTSATATPGSGGTASVSGPPVVNSSEVTVNLTNVSNVQTLAVNLIGVNDGLGHFGDVAIPMSVLIGDTTDNAIVNASDVGQTKAQSGQNATSSNFRLDVTANGPINAADVGLVKSKSGSQLPP